MFIDFRDEGGERDRQTEKETSVWEINIDWLSPVFSLTGYWTYNLRMCPDLELNLQPFGVENSAPTNWATQPGLAFSFKAEYLHVPPILLQAYIQEKLLYTVTRRYRNVHSSTRCNSQNLKTTGKPWRRKWTDTLRCAYMTECHKAVKMMGYMYNITMNDD